jgi:hypothetical protein
MGALPAQEPLYCDHYFTPKVVALKYDITHVTNYLNIIT